MRNLSNKTWAILFIALFLLNNVNGQTTDKKNKKGHKKNMVATPVWWCTLSSIKINCDINSHSGEKVVYVESYAGNSVYTNEWVKIIDANGNVVGTYGPMTGQYTTPPINLVSGQTYTVNIIDGNGVLHHENNGTPDSVSIVAPDCSKVVGPATGVGNTLVDFTTIDTTQINTCCPPWNKKILAESLSAAQPNINSPYTLIFSPSATAINQLTAYNNYLKTICPGKTLKIAIEVCKASNLNVGSGSCNVLEINADWINFFTPNIAPSFPYTLGSWAQSPGQGSSPSKPKLQVNQWYRIHTNIYQDPGESCFSKECSSVDVWYRVSYSALKASGNGKPQEAESILEISDGKKIIKTIKLDPKAVK